MFLNIKRNVYLVHASYTHIVLFLYISNIPRSQMCYYTPMFYMTAIQPAVVITYELIYVVREAHL